MDVRRLLIVNCFVLFASGCSHDVKLQADHGGFLTDTEIQPLDAAAKATTARESSLISGPALPDYVFAFRPGFDVSGITALRIEPFTALTDGGQEIAKDIAPAIIARSGGQKAIPPAMLASGAVQPGDYVLTGAVTRTIGADGSTIPLSFLHETSIAMRLSRNNEVLGVIQVNSVGRQPSPFLAAPTLLFSAFQGSRATLVSRRIEDVFTQLRAGHLSGASASPSDAAFMPVQPAVAK